jgi:hypothetical protein
MSWAQGAFVVGVDDGDGAFEDCDGLIGVVTVFEVFGEVEGGDNRGNEGWRPAAAIRPPTHPTC